MKKKAKNEIRTKRKVRAILNKGRHPITNSIENINLVGQEEVNLEERSSGVANNLKSGIKRKSRYSLTNSMIAEHFSYLNHAY